jgi:hypothetical protein
MLDRPPTSPRSVSLHCGGVRHPAVAVEISGHSAAVRTHCAPDLASDVRLEIAWDGGSRTSLRSRVRAVAPIADDEHLAHVEVCSVEGDWASFLAYVGPRFRVHE